MDFYYNILIQHNRMDHIKSIEEYYEYNDDKDVQILLCGLRFYFILYFIDLMTTF